MMESETPLQTPMLDDLDVATIVGLLVRVMKIDAANKRDKEEIAAISARLGARGIPRIHLINAIGTFGINMAGEGVWDRVKAAISPEKYAEAAAIGYDTLKPEEKREKVTSSNQPVSAQADQSSFGIGAEQAAKGVHPDAPKISDAILSYLASVSGRGVSVKEIKKHLRETYGIETHEKTPGMTLYRLSKDGKVRRDGRVWSYADAGQESEQSNIETQGLTPQNENGEAKASPDGDEVGASSEKSDEEDLIG